MKSLQQTILETKTKPSSLKQYKDTSVEKTIDFKAGDMFDTVSGTYQDKYKYYSDEGTGYITDKEGHVYSLKASNWTDDQGSIAGGERNWGCTIYKANGTDNLGFSGYHGVFSKPSSETCHSIVTDIENGMYLEDYIAKHWFDIGYDARHSGKWDELKSKGNPDAKTYKDDRNAKRLEREEILLTRYVVLPGKIGFTVTKNKINVNDSILINDKTLNANKKDNNERYIKDEINWDEKKAQDDEFANKRMEELCDGIFIPFITKYLNSLFKTSDISSYSGLCGVLENETKNYIAIDTKAKKLVCIYIGNGYSSTTIKKGIKVLNDEPKIFLQNKVTINVKDCSDKSLKLFSTASNAWKKLKKGTRKEYIEKNYLDIWMDSQDFYGNGNLTKTQARGKASENWEREMTSHDITKSDKLTFSLYFLKDFIQDDITEETPTNETPNTTSSTQIIISDKAKKEAEEKMEAWHNGTRKQNVKACSDAKLKMNYRICKEKGYDKEAETLKAESDSRGLKLESLSLKEFIEII